MYPYLISVDGDVYYLVVDSETRPLDSYLIRIVYRNNKVLKSSCSCKGFAIRGNCKHLSVAKKKVKLLVEKRNFSPDGSNF